MSLSGEVAARVAEVDLVMLAGHLQPVGGNELVVHGVEHSGFVVVGADVERLHAQGGAHGSVGDADEVHSRIDQDRAYLRALRDDQDPSDPRVGSSAKPGWEWVSDVHTGQLERLAKRGESDATPD